MLDLLFQAVSIVYDFFQFVFINLYDGGILTGQNDLFQESNVFQIQEMLDMFFCYEVSIFMVRSLLDQLNHFDLE